MGNSEVGHTNIGAGRVVYQMLVKITKDIRDGVFFENKALLAAMENCRKNDTALHLIGLVSPGGVHSHTKHLYGLLEMAKKHGLTKVYVHALLDGRDVPPDSAWEYVQELEDKMKEIGVGRIAMSALFSLVTLPVEYNASARAVEWLQTSRTMQGAQLAQAKEALSWAARTYLVAALSAIASVLYYVFLILGRRD